MLALLETISAVVIGVHSDNTPSIIGTGTRNMDSVISICSNHICGDISKGSISCDSGEKETDSDCESAGDAFSSLGLW